MKLQDALATGSAQKHVDSPIAGTYTVAKANLSPGYYQDFRADDPEQRSPFNTSSYVYAHEIPQIMAVAGEDGWKGGKCS